MQKIRDSFRKRAKTEHPDMFPGMDDEGKKAQAARFAELQEAWSYIKEHHEQVELKVEEVRQKAKFKYQATGQGSHAQDRRPSAPDSKSYGEPSTKNTEAAAQAREFIQKMRDAKAGGSRTADPASEVSSYSRRKAEAAAAAGRPPTPPKAPPSFNLGALKRPTRK